MLCNAEGPVYMILGIFALVGIFFFVIVLPLLVVAFAVTNVILEKKSPKHALSIHPIIKKTIGSIYNRFASGFYFWEILIMARKVFLVIAFAFLARWPTVGAVLSSFVILIALILQLRFNPYKHRTSNILETILLLIQYFILIFSLMIYSADLTGLDISYDVIISLLHIGLVAVGIFFGIAFFIIEIIWYLPIKSSAEVKAEALDEDLHEENNIQEEKVEESLVQPQSLPSHQELKENKDPFGEVHDSYANSYEQDGGEENYVN